MTAEKTFFNRYTLKSGINHWRTDEFMIGMDTDMDSLTEHVNDCIDDLAFLISTIDPERGTYMQYDGIVRERMTVSKSDIWWKFTAIIGSENESVTVNVRVGKISDDCRILVHSYSDFRGLLTGLADYERNLVSEITFKQDPDSRDHWLFGLATENYLKSL